MKAILNFESDEHKHTNKHAYMYIINISAKIYEYREWNQFEEIPQYLIIQRSPTFFNIRILKNSVKHNFHNIKVDEIFSLLYVYNIAVLYFFICCTLPCLYCYMLHVYKTEHESKIC